MAICVKGKTEFWVDKKEREIYFQRLSILKEADVMKRKRN